MPAYDRELRRLGEELSTYITLSNYDMEEAVMYMARLLTMRADEINMRWGAQRPSTSVIDHAHDLIFGTPDTGADPQLARDRNLWDMLCICQARIIELNRSLVRMCDHLETVYNEITHPFHSVRNFMTYEVQVRKDIAQKDIDEVEKTYDNAMQAWSKRSSNHWRDSSNLFARAFGRMLGNQTPPAGRGHVEQYEASKKNIARP